MRNCWFLFLRVHEKRLSLTENNPFAGIATVAKPHPVTTNAKKTTTVNKMNDRNLMPTAHSGTFACPNPQATASQAKEPEFLPTHRN
ncbi:hypothetical protein CHX27_03315 [Flavobacterium aurantiibacter]|uniref:Uncharacterized protein n=1 Tax=Flavobacterium aurantiibacter TaxID=2023067 RepID=A0A256A2B2_9FLAO|nr:hypothetical protein CHX27_03315 [Flavobacterium aurantiibacter]